jgi:putative two-component system response regulator
MPGKDGFALLVELSQSDQTDSIPVIMVTGIGERSLKRRALKMGATDLLNKPVDLEDLIARITNVLRIKSYQDELKQLNETFEKKAKDRTVALEDYRQDVIWRLAKAGEYRDKGTGNHVVRVGHYSRTLAKALDLSIDEVKTIFLTSALHDIGKIAIPDAILLKPGRLTSEERKVMQTHCEIGAQILQDCTGGSKTLGRSGVDNPLLKAAGQIALSHHEWWDGSGYPSGLAVENIPLESRIVSIADAYDALSTERPYKSAYKQDKVLEIMRAEVGAHFDPEVFEAFEQSLDQFRLIYYQYADDPRLYREAA